MGIRNKATDTLKSIYRWAQQRKKLVITLSCIVIGYYLLLPNRLFKEPTSTVLYDVNGELLAASISSNGQWCFPEIDTVPDKFATCIRYFEDQYFYYHPGVNPVSMSRALHQNVTRGKRISGGSTITMQTIRLVRRGKSRSLIEKVIEIVLATRLECRFSKEEIIAKYASYAPFGGNIIGLEAASWRYFGRKPDRLSWAESAMLAVLPNAPSLIFPGKNQHLLLVKRNRLLHKLYKNQVMDSLTYALALTEPIPESPFHIPRYTPHLIQRMIKDGHQGERIRSTIDVSLQRRSQAVVNRYAEYYRSNGVHNICVLVADVRSGDVLTYIGNTSINDRHHAGYVDIIHSQRSYGSLLKPFLYSMAIDDGLLAPSALLPDYPVVIGGYAPGNFFGTYDGAVPANQALSRSLNIPFVKLLQEYGQERFLYKTREIGMRSLHRQASHYGLSVVLGGGESTLWEITSVYASMARAMNHHTLYLGKYDKKDYHPLRYIHASDPEVQELDKTGYISYGALWHTFSAMLDVNRPGLESNWQDFASSHRIAWKTGTSFGFRDAWAVGVTPSHVVGVWVGNANGEGRPGLTGLSVASPIMFELFGLLPTSSWFEKPVYQMQTMSICRESGFKAGEWCNVVDQQSVATPVEKSTVCPYHKQFHFDKTGLYRVNADCYSVSEMVHKNYMVLPPVIEWYYKQKNPTYISLPPFKEGCGSSIDARNMDFIYPRAKANVYVPKQVDGTLSQVIFEIAHRKPSTQVHWHLDDQYISTTNHFHQLGLAPSEGKHKLTVIDELGEVRMVEFVVLSK